jgi:murein DD-endopeptidase MepM/ murein hydrolase activator NlpD
VISGSDLDQPHEHQRRGATLSHVGHGGVDLPQKRGTPIVMVPLEHQEGDAEVLFVGELFGRTVVTLHTLREGGQTREYVLLFGHLDAPATGLARGAHLASGDLVGTVGDTGSPELVHLHLEARRVRAAVNIRDEPGYKLVANECTVVCDPRNVLPMK